MRIGKEFLEDLSLIVGYVDAISSSSKAGAWVELGDGCVLFRTDQYDVLGIYLSTEELIGKMPNIPFRSHLFPNAKAPLRVSLKGDKVIFNWKDKGILRKASVISGKSYGKTLWNRFVEEYQTANPVVLTLDIFDVIDPSVGVLELLMEDDGLHIRQVHPTGDEVYDNVIPSTKDIPDSWGDFDSGGETREVEKVSIKVKTKDFLALKKLVADGFVISIKDADHPLSVRINLEHSNISVLLSNMIYEL